MHLSIQDLKRGGLRNPAVRSFSLIEMMVVLVVTAILASFLFAVLISARGRAHKKEAMLAARNIALALKSYRVEYGQWPNQTQQATDTVYVIDNYRVIQPLMGTNVNQQNPKNKIFLSAPQSFLDAYGNYLDPWGEPYAVGVDENGDGKLTLRFIGTYTNIVTGYTKTYQIAQVLLDPTNRTTYITNDYCEVLAEEAGAASFMQTTNSLDVLNSWTAELQ